MVSLVRNAVKLNFLVILLITTPLITELHYVLNLWLGQVPPNAVVFCSFTLLFNFFSNLSFCLLQAFMQQENIQTKLNKWQFVLACCTYIIHLIQVGWGCMDFIFV